LTFQLLSLKWAFQGAGGGPRLHQLAWKADSHLDQGTSKQGSDLGLIEVSRSSPLRSTATVVLGASDRIDVALWEPSPAQAEMDVAGVAITLPGVAWDPTVGEWPGAPAVLERSPPRSGASSETEKVLESVVISCDPAGVLTLLARKLPLWKRAGDVALSLLGLVLLSPLLVLIAVAVKLTSPGPALFRQLRTGRGLRRFSILKFRTMRVDAEELRESLRGKNEMSGPLFKMKRDPRLSTIGAFLRRSSLDELPQLVNVLRGDMTLIGPRALSPVPSRYERWQLPRFELTPGIACTWQAARRGERDFDEWMRSDLRYCERGDTALADARLLLATLSAVITGAGSR
jgi:lipopolysaccharide/colanic/teichoic acid biosynthesis glycosyltransferase